jgi:hypothetical protein
VFRLSIKPLSILQGSSRHRNRCEWLGRPPARIKPLPATAAVHNMRSLLPIVPNPFSHLALWMSPTPGLSSRGRLLPLYLNPATGCGTSLTPPRDYSPRVQPPTSIYHTLRLYCSQVIHRRCVPITTWLLEQPVTIKLAGSASGPNFHPNHSQDPSGIVQEIFSLE